MCICIDCGSSPVVSSSCLLADETIVPPDVPSYLSSQGTLSDRQETVVRTEGGHQASVHIESNGKFKNSETVSSDYVLDTALPPCQGRLGICVICGEPGLDRCFALDLVCTSSMVLTSGPPEVPTLGLALCLQSREDCQEE